MPRVLDVVAHAIQQGRLTLLVLVSMFCECTDLSPEAREFFATYQEALIGSSDNIDAAGDNEPVVTAPSKPVFYQRPDGTVVTSRDREKVLTWPVLMYIREGIDSNDPYYMHGYINKPPPRRKSTECVLTELGPEVRAMYEAKPVTRFAHGTPLADILGGKVKGPAMRYTGEIGSSMKSVFHPPPPLTDLFTPARTSGLEQLWNDLELGDGFDLSSWVKATNTISAMMRALRLTVADGKVHTDRRRKKTSNATPCWTSPPVQKETQKVVWPMRTSSERAFLPDALKSNRKYAAAIELMGKISGRMLNMRIPALTAEAALLDKTGVFADLIRKIPINELDGDTAIFCTLVVAKMSSRKAFTLAPQIQGTLDKFMMTWYRQLLCKSPTTQWSLVASLLPVKEVLDQCNPTDLRSILEQWMHVVMALHKPLTQMWFSRVRDAALRNMLVPRGVDTTAWNTMSGAWNNARRFIASLCNALEIPIPWAITKCLKVTAGDQMSWGSSSGKGVDPDCLVFAELAKMGRAPWSALDEHLSVDTIMADIGAICADPAIADAYTARGVTNPVAKWRPNGSAKMRTHAVRADADMVCGVAVEPPGTAAHPATWTVSKQMGMFGATPWNSL